MTFKTKAIRLINKDIEWHKKHPDTKGIPPLVAGMFIAGLRQAVKIIMQIEEDEK